ncbi:MAG: protease modulator HflK [Planctomycetes bacterium]|nr:protease modulator HflK [Planctomycetota bacterium]
MNVSPRRAEIVSLWAFIIQGLFFFLILLISSQGFSNSRAVGVEAWHFLGGSIIWLILLLQFRQRRLAQEEKLDAEQYQRLRSEGKDTSVFESSMIEGTLHLAQRRLLWLEKYLVGIFSFLSAGYFLGVGVWQFLVVKSISEPELAGHESLLGAAAGLASIALVSFLFSRYAVGMSRQPQWRPLRAGGSYLLGNALACFVLAIVLLVSDAGYLMAERMTGFVLVVLMLAIGAETIGNLILDAYRPRLKDRYHRTAYESRLLGLFSEPGGLLHTAAHAIDYQFGFKVSETWFYRLLERAILPLIVAQVVILYLFSCIAIVETGDQAVVERWGKPLNISKPWESGVHLKLPWPIDYVRSFPASRLQTLDVGFKREEGEAGLAPVLWTQAHHGEEELALMVAVASIETGLANPGGDSGADDARNDFDLLDVGLTIHYRISDLSQYGYGQDRCYKDPRGLLEAVCYREVLHYAARSDVDSLLGPGRHKTTQDLRGLIQRKVDQEKMGIEIVFVGLVGVHPPIEVAEEYEKVVAAVQEKQSLVLNAIGAEYEILALARGESKVILAEAEARKNSRSWLAKSQADRFAYQVIAYKKGGPVYLWREYLSVLDEFLPRMRKYFFASSNVTRLIYEIDLKEQLKPDLFEGLELPDSVQENEN